MTLGFLRTLRRVIYNHRLALRHRVAVLVNADIRNLNRIVDEQRRENQALRIKLDSINERWQEFVDDDRAQADAKLAAQSAEYERRLSSERLAAEDEAEVFASERDALARQLAAAEKELDATKHNLELRTKAFEVAEDQNETLWEVIERDRARVQAEKQAYQRSAAEAESASRTLAAADGDE
jgi:hypothetical protein